MERWSIAVDRGGESGETNKGLASCHSPLHQPTAEDARDIFLGWSVSTTYKLQLNKTAVADQSASVFFLVFIHGGGGTMVIWSYQAHGLWYRRIHIMSSAVLQSVMTSNSRDEVDMSDTVLTDRLPRASFTSREQSSVRGAKAKSNP